ncbi:MAG: Acetylxylan esterase, partial [Labilithrix sp.]|nr:Acetylxylan esterase [Labilithrix sp.]
FLLVAVGSASCSSSSKKTSSGPRPSSSDTADRTGKAESPGSETGGPGPATASPDTIYQPLFVGRFDTTDPAGPRASWPGTRVLARFEGTSVSVKLKEHAEDWMEGAPSYWEIRIDKGTWKPIAMIADNQPHDFELASGLPAGPHEVEIYKRSETQTGVTQFLGFDFHGGKSLPPPPRQTRKIEVMGDSFATGFGIENITAPDTDCPGPDWAGRWQNFRKAWGAILGETFDAEVHGIVYSAKGLLTNDWPTDNDPLRDYYNRADPNPEIAQNPPLFDLSSWIPDVIIMTQGSGDGGGSDFRAAYRDFVINRLRARGPNTHIFMGIVSAGNREAVADISQSIVAERAAVGDHKMHAFMPTLFTWEEVTACNGHGTPAWQQRIANELATQIRAAVGWQ